MAKKIRMVYDAMGSPIQGALHPVGTDVKTISASPNKTTAGFLDGYEVVELFATVACFIRFSTGEDATVSDMPFPANIVKRYSLKGATYIGVIGTSGSLYVTKFD
jgi:hypothetical protein